jgi:hypothetical protein
MRGRPWALARSTRSASRRCWFLIFSASSPTGASCSASFEQLVGFRFVGGVLDPQQALRVGEQVDRIVWRHRCCRPQMGQGRCCVVLHQQELAEGAQRKGIARLQHHRLLQRALGGVWILVPQGGDAQGNLGVGIAGVQLHRPAQQLPGFCELHPVAVDNAQVVEALHVAWLQLQAHAQQRDGHVVPTGLEVLSDGGAGWYLSRLGLPGHLDQALPEFHIHPAAGFPVGVLVVGGDGLAEGLAAWLLCCLRQQAQIKALLRQREADRLRLAHAPGFTRMAATTHTSWRRPVPGPNCR